MTLRVCLVSAPTIAEFGDLDPLAEEGTPRVPLGVLVLAGVLGQKGLRRDVLDLDREFTRWRCASRRRGDFVRHVVDELEARRADVYGLSSMCGTYPLTLRIATALRSARPGARIVLGGPQATASADETLAAFPAVDAIVRGEGEVTLPALLDAYASSGDLSRIPGLTYRTTSGVARTADAPPIEDLDALPAAAYDLCPELRLGSSIPIEVGRGCPFACTFCSTSRFFGRRFRVRSPERVVRQMLALARAFGTRRFDLVHDNFTVDRRAVLAFCEAVVSARAGLRWTCSSRTDTIDESLVDAMWRAGCRGFFFGVESGSPSMQRRIAKRLDLSRARDVLRHVSRRRMASALSFIQGFPDEREDELRDTVTFFVDALRFDFLEPQIGLLSPLSGTPLEARHRTELLLDGVVPDMAFQGDAQLPADRLLVARHPRLFSSFYSFPTRWLDRGELDELRRFLVAARFELRWLLVAAAQVAGDGLAAFRAFRAWRPHREAAASPPRLRAYYRSRAFRRDFIRFVRDRLASEHAGPRHALLALARYYMSLQRASRAPRATGGTAVARDVTVTRIPCDGAALIEALRTGGDLSSVPRRPSVVVTRLRNERHEILQMTDEALDLLALCDGRRDERAIARAFRGLHAELGGAFAQDACAFGLASLERHGLIVRATARRSGHL